MAWWALPPAPRWDCRGPPVFWLDPSWPVIPVIRARFEDMWNNGNSPMRSGAGANPGLSWPVGATPRGARPRGHASKLLLQFHVKLCNLSTWRHALGDGSELAFGCRH